LNWFDVLIALVIFTPAFFGYINGFLRKLFGLIGLAGGFILAVRFFNPLGNVIAGILHTPRTGTLLFAFGMILAAVYAVAVYLSKYMANLHPASRMIDRILGAAAGGLQGLLLAGIILFNLNYLGFPSQDVKSRSMLYPKVIGVAPAFFDKLISFFPGAKTIYEEYKKLGE
jgi:membrane protein required for colicin V production